MPFCYVHIIFIYQIKNIFVLHLSAFVDDWWKNIWYIKISICEARHLFPCVHPAVFVSCLLFPCVHPAVSVSRHLFPCVNSAVFVSRHLFPCVHPAVFVSRHLFPCVHPAVFVSRHLLPCVHPAVFVSRHLFPCVYPAVFVPKYICGLGCFILWRYMLVLIVVYIVCFNLLAPEWFDYSLELVNFKLISTINILSTFCEIANRWMPQHLTDH